jgi:hypothetical protein
MNCGKQSLLMQIDELKEKVLLAKKKRIRQDWLPDKVVCIRFGVAQPKKHNSGGGNVDFDAVVMPALEKDLKKNQLLGMDLEHMIKAEDAREEEEKDKVRMPDENNVNVGMADQDLFDSIFN